MLENKLSDSHKHSQENALSQGELELFIIQHTRTGHARCARYQDWRENIGNNNCMIICYRNTKLAAFILLTE
jgi:hypothetical protein